MDKLEAQAERDLERIAAIEAEHRKVYTQRDMDRAGLLACVAALAVGMFCGWFFHMALVK